MLVTGADLKPYPYFRDPAKPYIEKIARAQSKWLQPYDDPKLFPQDGDRMIATGMRGGQFRIYRDPARTRIAATGRRWGKCLAEGTLVSMADGRDLPVERVRAGDVVVAIDAATMQPTHRRVVATAANGIKATLRLNTVNGTLQGTPHHPVRSGRGWLRLDEVSAGDVVATWHGDAVRWTAVDGVESAGDAPTHDLQIETDRTFIANGIVTHNTTLCVHELTRAAQTGWRRNVGYIAPTLKDAKRLMWLELKRAIPPDMLAEAQNTILSVTIRGYESRIRLFGADRPESIYGEGFNFLIIDEAQSIPAGFFQRAVRPTLVDKSGELLMTLRPEGFNWVFDEFVAAEQDQTGHATAFNFTTIDGENVPVSEIERERLQMDPTQFSQEYEGSFTNPQGRVYTQFTRKDNVDPAVKDLGGLLHIGMDFNVAPFACVLGSLTVDGDLWIFDEIEEFGGHTALVADRIKRRYPDRPIVIYPDASGRQRRTSGQGMTDFHLLAQAGFRVDAPAKNPAIKDRINVLQAVFRNAAGQVRCKIHPRCRQLIRSLEALSYTPAGVPDKENGYDHLPDALGYLTWRRFPIVRYRTGMAKLAA